MNYPIVIIVVIVLLFCADRFGWLCNLGPNEGFWSEPDSLKSNEVDSLYKQMGTSNKLQSTLR